MYVCYNKLSLKRRLIIAKSAYGKVHKNRSFFFFNFFRKKSHDSRARKSWNKIKEVWKKFIYRHFFFLFFFFFEKKFSIPLKYSQKQNSILSLCGSWLFVAAVEVLSLKLGLTYSQKFFRSKKIFRFAEGAVKKESARETVRREGGKYLKNWRWLYSQRWNFAY